MNLRVFYLTRRGISDGYVRRRKWIDRSTGEIFTYEYDNLTESGSKLTPEFVAFLKEED